jgi:hypothetical protein
MEDLGDRSMIIDNIADGLNFNHGAQSLKTWQICMLGR